MNYHLHIDGEEKPKRIYFRNHGHSYIKKDKTWIRIYFNPYRFDEAGRIKVVTNSDNEWEMESQTKY